MVEISLDFIKGFIEGEGCFTLTIHHYKSKKKGILYYVNPRFTLSQHKDNRKILIQLKNFFEFGKILQHKLKKVNNVGITNSNNLVYCVLNFDDCQKFIKILGKNPFFGSKIKDYNRWKTIIHLVKDKKKFKRNDKILQQIFTIRNTKINYKGRRRIY